MKYKFILETKYGKQKKIEYWTFEELKEIVKNSLIDEDPYTRPDYRSLKDVAKAYFEDYNIIKIIRLNY